ncbi:cytochrome c biogenesis protein CcsA [Gynurincola endophyticus]|uniref:cytochrome c biogenesis protein CcsA n=1 Tax=Gynurincola endophyticus TaxID=2479004 RepID=UPI000F8CE872|nr:cytochrome c biogenesis protein CcsA [Gynurincola endophyticus]
MNFVGEHLLPGQIGHFLVILSLVASLVAMIAYFKAATVQNLQEALSWKKLGRIAFAVDAFSITAVFAIIFYLIYNHYFEYYYVYNHSDRSLSVKFLLSSIWEGQEGSFLLWAFWHGVIGLMLMKTAKKWEAPVMTTISFAQALISTMILGIYIFDLKMGNSPFILTRQQFPDAPIFQRPDYVHHIADGNGLNQLLQNYWMVIHPPILFLGFAATIVPFAYAIAGLWKKDFGGWTKVSMPWLLFSTAVLGLGIMLGAIWAYESLSFGGYWAWDPVENASLVPWMIFVAAIHTQLVYNSTGHSLRATYVFYILAYIFIIYSTYLTRSGALQDTSVHAFVDTGTSWQIKAFLWCFVIPPVFLLIRRYKQIPAIQKEENLLSREFWMFIGSLVLFLAGIYIIGATSLPVINTIFGTSLDVGENVEFSYNRVQIFVAILIGLLTAVTQYFKYKDTAKKTFYRKIALPTIISVVIAVCISVFGAVNFVKYGAGFLAAIHLAIFASVYTVVANFSYIWIGFKGNLKVAGASISHVGFGLMLVGILISSSKQEILSMNWVNPLNFGEEAQQKGWENLTLYQGVPFDMGEYWATYTEDSTVDNGRIMYFFVELAKKDGSETFVLKPDVIKNTKGATGYSNNPDSKHYWNRDIFSYVNASDKLMSGEDTATFRKHSAKVGDTLFFMEGYIKLDSVVVNPTTSKKQFGANDTAIQANFSVYTQERKLSIKPIYYLENGQPKKINDTLFSQGLAIGIDKVIDDQTLEVSVKESSRMVPFIALKIIKFPFINVLWIGTFVMLLGFAMSMLYRIRLKK